MPNQLHYSPLALARRSGWMLLATAVVLVDYVAHAHGSFPHVFGLGVAPSAALMGASLYIIGATVVLTLGLMRHGGTALAVVQEGVILKSAWSTKTFAWAHLSTIALDVRYTKSSRYTVVALREATGVLQCHTVDTRLMVESLDQVSAWVEETERQRMTHGGAAYKHPSTGLAGYNARKHAADLAIDIAGARLSTAKQPWRLG